MRRENKFDDYNKKVNISILFCKRLSDIIVLNLEESVE